MQAETATRLINLNQQFYQTFTRQFSDTRQRLQPGVRRVLERLLRRERVLDLGCGNGELWRELVRQGFQGSYLGMDFSEGLLKLASNGLDSQPHPQVDFRLADLTEPGWEKNLSDYKPQVVLAFAVLHHIPSAGLHRRILNTVHDLMSPEGEFIFSVWQFLNSPRLAQRIQPWEVAGLNADEVDEGDYLLDWRQGGQGLRYVHHFSLPELETLAEETGFRVDQVFWSDGKNGKLGVYQVWTLC